MLLFAYKPPANGKIKASKTLRPEMTRSLKLADSSGSFGKSIKLFKHLVSFHENQFPLDGGVNALPWWDV